MQSSPPSFLPSLIGSLSVDLAGLEQRSSCFRLPSAVIKAMYHYAPPDKFLIKARLYLQSWTEVVRLEDF